jgi:hypothetical protein
MCCSDPFMYLSNLVTVSGIFGSGGHLVFYCYYVPV